MSKTEEFIRHVPCMCHSIAFRISTRLFAVSQQVDVGMVLDLADDFAVAIVGVFIS